jgi:hypothetical protein
LVDRSTNDLFEPRFQAIGRLSQDKLSLDSSYLPIFAAPEGLNQHQRIAHSGASIRGTPRAGARRQESLADLVIAPQLMALRESDSSLIFHLDDLLRRRHILGHSIRPI